LDIGGDIRGWGGDIEVDAGIRREDTVARETLGAYNEMAQAYQVQRLAHIVLASCEGVSRVGDGVMRLAYDWFSEIVGVITVCNWGYAVDGHTIVTIVPVVMDSYLGDGGVYAQNTNGDKRMRDTDRLVEAYARVITSVVRGVATYDGVSSRARMGGRLRVTACRT
jgi:hypothetical protein